MAIYSLGCDWVTKFMSARSVGAQSIGEVVPYYQILGRHRALTSNVTKYNQKPLIDITLQQSQNLDVIASPNNCS